MQNLRASSSSPTQPPRHRPKAPRMLHAPSRKSRRIPSVLALWAARQVRPRAVRARLRKLAPHPRTPLQTRAIEVAPAIWDVERSPPCSARRRGSVRSRGLGRAAKPRSTEWRRPPNACARRVASAHPPRMTETHRGWARSSLRSFSGRSGSARRIPEPHRAGNMLAGLTERRLSRRNSESSSLGGS